MPKKIYDIRPPKVARKVEKDIKDFLEQPKVAKVRRIRKAKPEKVVVEAPCENLRENVVHYGNKEFSEKKSFWKPISVGVSAIVVLAGVYLFFTLPKADITVWPKIEPLTLNQKITADKSINSVDENKLA